ncbi:ArsR/SmtB family transcription factor [Pseudarthrobacter sp. H2]|uniref:ArsR/SmtB family transcription factor n=1 Tax=Pseudarthrobacter sp. H2 TaxID=3418415 RepID=UPI003CEA7BAA
MSSLIRPELPSQVEAAISFMGNRAQAAILRHLSLLGPSVIGRLQSVMAISRPSLNRHLDSLATAGLVQTDPPAGMRHGKDVTYTAQPARIRELAHQYLSYVQGR